MICDAMRCDAMRCDATRLYKGETESRTFRGLHDFGHAYHLFAFLFFQVQGKDPSVDFTQDIVEESEDERCFDEISDSVPAIDLPACEIAKLEEISELVSSCLPSPIRREKLAVAIENEVKAFSNPPIFRKGSVVILGNTKDVSDGIIVCQDDETYQTHQTQFQLLVSSLCYSNILSFKKWQC
jgi:hypothetical protein